MFRVGRDSLWLGKEQRHGRGVYTSHRCGCGRERDMHYEVTCTRMHRAHRESGAGRVEKLKGEVGTRMVRS